MDTRFRVFRYKNIEEVIMKKVLIVTALAGFVRSFLKNDIVTLQEMGYTVECAANKNHPGAGKIEEFFDEMNVKFYNIPFSSNSPFSKQTLVAYKSISKLLKNNNYEMIHVHTPIAGAVVKLAARKYRKKGCKIVYTTHGFYFHSQSSKKTWMLYFNFEKILSKYTDYIITINKEDYGNAKKMYCKNIRYINGVGVNTEKFENVKIDRKAYRENENIAINDIVVMSVGELSNRKNHRIIVEALAKLNDERYLYIICGNDMNENGTSEQLKELAKEKNVRIRLLGLRDDIPQLCKVADIGAFPSSREGLGLAGIEMLASGMPIVSSNVQGIKDYMEDGKTGYIYNPSDADGFAEGIKKLTDENVREKMSEYCVQKAKQFDINISKTQMKHIYEEVLERK